MKKNLLFILLTITLITSCKKEDNSSSITTSNVSSTATTGTWRVTYYWDTNKDETTNFSGYNFTFGSGNVLTANKSTTSIVGSWTTGTDDSKVKLILNFSSPADFLEISDDWHVIERTDTKIKLQDISGGNGGTDYLTFEKN